jgi:alpha-tubulin suppressor-like RCC1 family protein
VHARPMAACGAGAGTTAVSLATALPPHVLSPVRVTALGSSVAQVTAGFLHTCARRADATVWCWGENFAGQLGDGTTSSRAMPVQVAGLVGAVAEVSAGGGHSCARQTDGTLWCWGFNVTGQLGDGTATDRLTPIQVSALGTTVTEVSAGAEHTCARRTGSTLWCWGRNHFGQVGDGTFADRAAPVQVAALEASVAQSSAGYSHTCARKTDGTLWCWGANFSGQLGDGTETERLIPVEVATLGAAVAEVSAGGSHSCARKSDHSVWCWGAYLDDSSGDPTPRSICGDGVCGATETQAVCPSDCVTPAPVPVPRWSAGLLAAALACSLFSGASRRSRQ